jgi:NADP-dependent 3-hydroxy acid dehydrogenase YdfG
MKKRTWFITGVNSGFGRQMTEQLLQRGDLVAGTVRKMDGMKDLEAKYGDRLWLANLELTDTPAIHEVVDKAFADLGKIDVFVICSPAITSVGRTVTSVFAVAIAKEMSGTS